MDDFLDALSILFLPLEVDSLEVALAKPCVVWELVVLVVELDYTACAS